MALEKEEKQEIIGEFKTNEKDVGSPEVQVALLTNRINQLGDHFKSNPKDEHSKRGLLMLVSRRRKLLKYLKREYLNRYTSLIGRLGLRK